MAHRVLFCLFSQKNQNRRSRRCGTQMQVPVYATVIIAVVVGLVCLIAGAVLGYQRRKAAAEREIGSAEEEARRIINDAIKSAESKKREATVEAKEEILKARSEFDKEVKDRRGEIQRQENRLNSKEENLDRKLENLERKEENVSARIAQLEQEKQELDGLKNSQLELLERISGLTVEEAKRYLIEQLEDDVTHEQALKLKEIQARYKEEAEVYAREQIALAIQRCAADHVAEATVSVVPLPNDEMKGRIIGREGRNIRTLETMTGVDLIIDDTPEAITVSCFDPVRREIARLALEKLILDGRIHPTRIEEMVEKAKREVDATIRAEGERAVFETNVHGLNPELVKLLGRQHYRTSYGQNVLNHSIEVSQLAGLLAAEIGVNVAEAKRAGLLHDLGKSIDHEVDGSHVQIGVELARKYRESENVIHAIEAHHGDVEARTIVACLVQAADAISAARPGARKENVEYYIKRLEKLEELTSSFPGVDKAFAIQAGREVRIMVNPEAISEDRMVLLAREIAKKIEDELEYPGQIKVNLIRETKAIEYAK
ncbi:MAG: ribonuclease Y [Clostridiales bacterium]|nr:ribonuclease Y [Clostridiales bacterium]